MKTFQEFMNESVDDSRLIRKLMKQGAEDIVSSQKKKISGNSYKVGDYNFLHLGRGELQITKNGKEIDYRFNMKDDQIVDLMLDYKAK
ncbi:hypothetical protein [Providencia phage PSTRCR_127]|nr:hypothetical protein [Providencia phage PSTRCR_127]